MRFVELDRDFVPFEGSRQPPPMTRAFGRRYGGWLGWDDLLQRKRVVVLAEASAGKTTEFRARADALKAGGRCAFFVRVDTLAQDGVEAALAPDERAIFRDWLGSEDPAWMFLDSVDEARLVRQEFDQALKVFAEVAAPALGRAHVYVSCRVSDWRGDLDLEALRRRLPVPRTAPAIPRPAGRNRLPGSISERADDLGRRPASENENFSAATDDVLVVALQPLDVKQIGRLAAAEGVGDSETFTGALVRNRLEVLAERPGDLLELVAHWREHGRFGSLAEMMEDAVTRKLGELDGYRADNNLLPIETARGAAERLAAAMTLGQALTVRAPGQGPDPALAAGAIDARQVLPRLTDAQRNALLRRGLFAPATYGRLRFHHRSSQEFLTARWLDQLIACGAGQEVRDLLFATAHGIEVVVPSMRPAAAWLALWHDEIRAQVLRHDPLLLVEEGDPASLPLQARARMLRCFAERNREHALADPWLESRMLRLFADARLADTIREVWTTHPDPDVQEHLLRLVQLGPVPACADLTREVVLDSAPRESSRIYALRALVACGDGDGVATAAAALFHDPGDVPTRVAVEWLDLLFPDCLGVDGLLHVVSGMPAEGRRDAMQEIGRGLARKSAALAVEARERLLTGLTALCGWQPAADGRRDVPKRFAPLAKAIGPILHDVLAAIGDCEPSPAILDVCALYERAGDKEDKLALAELVRRHPSVNRAVMWHDVGVLRAEHPRRDIVRFWQVWSGPNMLWELGHGDVDWLRRDARERPRPDERRVALSGLVAVAQHGGDLQVHVASLRALVQGEPELETDLEQLLGTAGKDCATATPVVQSAGAEEPEVRTERKKRAAWNALAERLKTEPESLVDEERPWRGRLRDIITLNQWLQQRARRNQHVSTTDWRLLEEGFGPAVAASYAAALRRLWRVSAPVAPVENEDGTITYAWATLLSLDGLAIEASTGPRWHEGLSPEETLRATGHVCLARRNVPDWFEAFVAARAATAGPVLEAELTREWDRGSADGTGNYLIGMFAHGGTGTAHAIKGKFLQLMESRPPRGHALEEAKANRAPRPYRR